MKLKLTWQEIKKQYAGRWVLLVNYDWDDSAPYPSAGVVNVSASTREEFNEKTSQSSAANAARVFVSIGKS